jgi:cytochrome c-type biogenesis protein CcmH/NrfG
MENYLEYIDAYFNQQLNAEEAKQFEQKISEDEKFADEVAFYLSAKQALKEQVVHEKKEWFRQLLAQNSSFSDREHTGRIRKMWTYRLAAAVAILICVFFAWYLFLLPSASPQQMADRYINENLKPLSVKMGARDSMEDGKRFYNEDHLDSALQQFETILQKDTGNYLAKEYAGIVYLRFGNYDKALRYFQQLENYSSLFSNPAIFYQALTLIKRNQPGDKQKAKLLLQQVVDNDLEKKETAKQWLKKW